MPFVLGIEVSHGTEKQLHGRKGQQTSERKKAQRARKCLGSAQHLKEIDRKYEKVLERWAGPTEPHGDSYIASALRLRG